MIFDCFDNFGSSYCYVKNFTQKISSLKTAGLPAWYKKWSFPLTMFFLDVEKSAYSLRNSLTENFICAVLCSSFSVIFQVIFLPSLLLETCGTRVIIPKMNTSTQDITSNVVHDLYFYCLVVKTLDYLIKEYSIQTHYYY